MAIKATDQNQQIKDHVPIQQALLCGPTIHYWNFPPTAKDQDGCGKLTVSKAQEVTVAGTARTLAVHVTMSIEQIFVPSLPAVPANPNEYRLIGTPIKISIKNLHFTARPWDAQMLISDGEGSAAQPKINEVSTHRGIVNDWIHVGNKDRLKKIVTALALPDAGDVQLAASETAIANALSSFDGLALGRVKADIQNKWPNQVRGKVRYPEKYRNHDYAVEIDFG